MRNQLKRELEFLGDHIALVILAAFLASVGGVLLWINGGSSWYFIRYGASGVPLGVIFSVWCITYALAGASAALIWLVYSDGRCGYKKALPLFSVAALSYLFMLVWYAVFFCTRLNVFAAVILILSCVADIFLFVSMRRTMLTFEAATVVVFVVQTYFVYFSFVSP